MKISEFKNLIKEIPYQNQSFDIKRVNWKSENQEEFIEKIFNGENSIVITRGDLFNAVSDTREFIVKTLMWGYPTKGRGRNIEHLLKEDNFEILVEILDSYKVGNITIAQLKKDIKRVEGLGISAMTKFIYFLQVTVDGKISVILDNQIIELINAGRYDELNEEADLKGIRYDNAINKYPAYLNVVNEVAEYIDVLPDQVEMFLFTFGRTLAEVK